VVGIKGIKDTEQSYEGKSTMATVVNT
jgi:hypothetical protein